LKVSNAINKFIYAEKLEQIKQLKIYITENVDDDFSFSINGDDKNLEDFCSLLDMFVDDTEKKILKIKSNKKAPTKAKKGQTFYNYWVSKRLAELGEEQKQLDEDKRIPNKNRMKHVTPEWNEFKQSDEFEEEKRKWEETQSSSDDSGKVNEKKTKKKKTIKKKSKVETDSTDDSDDSI
tara:strand:+ start:132 stop:668 length:537 start_codon:yes stop_codon:yes gene_type:complete